MKLERLSQVDNFDRISVDGREAFSADRGVEWQWADTGEQCEVDVNALLEVLTRRQRHEKFSESRARAERKGTL